MTKNIAARLRIPVDQQDDWIIGTDKLKEEAADEIEKLYAGIVHAAGFLDGMAARIERWRRWDNGEGDVGSFTMAAEDCRAMAASLKREWKTRE